MMDADRLIHEIAEGEQQLFLLKQQLKDVQQNCVHHYIEENAHRVCTKCKRMESLHY
ncbi:hypothetical protein OXB_2233 [Bacillus sp. OxB-1]|uniref:hypothetical protein n=1 Tax=Bacillus sp. (strain OxB-1) TaxID=98228 RepID=UPI000582217A|nr:hypothetical protein [Bacillus sp. OxB-1]BAQ10704.1 hypothetical protein OXB_2233 [Bacillus sp. OxB-1]